MGQPGWKRAGCPGHGGKEENGAVVEKLMLKICFAKRSNGDGMSVHWPARSLHWDCPGGLREFWGAGVILQDLCDTSLPVK